MIAADRTLEFFQIVELLGSSSLGRAASAAPAPPTKASIRQDEQEFSRAVNQLAFNISHVRFDLESLENHFRHGAPLSAGIAPEQKVLTIKTSLQQLQSEASVLSDRENRGRGGSRQSREHRRAVLERILEDLKKMTQRFKGTLEHHQKRSKVRRSRFSKFGPDVSNSFDVQNLRQSGRNQFATASSASVGMRGAAAAPEGAGGMRRRGAGAGAGASSGGGRGSGGAWVNGQLPPSQDGSSAAPSLHGPGPQLAAGAMGLVETTEQLIPDSVYDQTRASDVRQIESTIVEMGSMFGQVGCVLLDCNALFRFFCAQCSLQPLRRSVFVSLFFLILLPAY